MTKTKKLAAFMATIAVGATAVAGMALISNVGQKNLVVYASTAEDETQTLSLEFGTNEISLASGVAQTYSLVASEAGLYGFELPYTVSEEDGSKTYDVFTATVTVTINGASYTLNSQNPVVELELSSPSTTTVTLTSDADVEFDLHLTYRLQTTALHLGSNTLSLTANQTTYCILEGNAAGVLLAGGYYTFEIVSGTASFNFYVNGETVTYVIGAQNESFTVRLDAPLATTIPVTSTSTATVTFTISYSETDPDAASNTLNLGSQTVNATGEGEEYTFTSAGGGVYTLACTDDNAFVMIETAYGAEWIETPYTFTLSAGESILFYMATNDWNDDAYTVTLTQAITVGSQTVNATGDGETYTFTSVTGGTYVLACTYGNAFIMTETAYGAEWIETPYTFTLSAGSSATFLMSTNDWSDDTYEVTITEVVED